MRVAIDARLIGGTNTGDSTYWTCFIEALSRNHQDVELVFISNQEMPKNVPFLQGCSWIFAPTRSSRWWSMVTFPLMARKAGAHILHGQYGISPLAKNGISTVHDVSFMVNPSWFSARDHLLLKSGVQLASRSAKRIVTVSETSKQEIILYFPNAASKTRVAMNACPPWIQKSTDKERVRQMGIEGEYVLTVGTNWARKNMQLAVNVASNCFGEIPMKLIITGKQSGDFVSNHVIATGYVDIEMLSALYSGAKAYLAPSLHEGFGITVLESMRCGTPVICGPGGAMPEVAGTAGFVMPDYDSETWTKAISKILRDPSKLSELSTNGIKREQDFTWEKSARAHYDVYRELL